MCPLLNLEVVDVKLDVLGRGSRLSIGDKFNATVAAAQVQLGIDHAVMVVIVDKVVVVDRPLPISYDGIVGEETGIDDRVGERGVASQPVAGLLFDVLLPQQEETRIATSFIR